tara:strand:- start:370 stop:765 length:396 start_codon:yes stop_codon:yes gene_type:complete
MALEHIKKQMEILRERAKKEREKRKNKNKPVRVQPKLPGMKKGGSTEPKYSVKDEVKDRMKKETPKTGYGIGLSPITQLRRRLHRQRIKKERARDKAKTRKMKQGGIAFGGEKRIPGSGAATKGTGFKGIF